MPNIHRRVLLLCCCLACCLPVISLLKAGPEAASGIRILKLSDAVRFQMGRVKSWRIVYPAMGARNLTFNMSISEPGDEFPQHVHDHSDDTFLVLDGQADVRQGSSRRSLPVGHAAFVPAGQIHGTITTGSGPATLISFQCPPDAALYTGARDSSRPGAAAPKGLITPGAVKLLDFGSQNGFFTNPGMGSKGIAIAYRKLKPGEEVTTAMDGNGEEVIFVWRGSVKVQSGAEIFQVGEREGLFISGSHQLRVQNNASGETAIVQAQAPPPHLEWSRSQLMKNSEH